MKAPVAPIRPIRDELTAIAAIVFISLLTGTVYVNGGIGFGPMYIKAVGSRSGAWSSVHMYGSSGHPLTNSIPAAINAERTRPFTDFIPSSQLSLGVGNKMPVIMPWVYEENLNPTSQPAALNGIETYCAKFKDSWSFMTTQNLTDSSLPLPLSASAKASCSFWLNLRQAVTARSCSVSFCAFSARSLASPASFFASPSSSFDSFLSAVWMRLSNIPNRTSPTIPIPMTASGQIDSFKNVSYGGSHQAMMSSTATERTTNTPHQIPHVSQEEDATSSSGSEAFFVPFGKYHAGMNRVRTLASALLAGVLFWGAVFAMWRQLGWIG